jgi:hypothetical protein
LYRAIEWQMRFSVSYFMTFFGCDSIKAVASRMPLSMRYASKEIAIWLWSLVNTVNTLFSRISSCRTPNCRTTWCRIFGKRQYVCRFGKMKVRHFVVSTLCYSTFWNLATWFFGIMLFDILEFGNLVFGIKIQTRKYRVNCWIRGKWSEMGWAPLVT